MNSKHFICLFYAILVCFTSVAQAKLSTAVDKTIIGEHDILTLSVTFNGRTDNKTPSFRALNTNFELIDQKQSTHYSSINGKVTTETVWTLELLPKTTGTIKIPALTLDKYTAPSIPITVKQGMSLDSGQASKDVILEVVTNQTEVYLNEQVILTLQLYHRDAFYDARLNEPNITNTQIIALGDETSRRAQKHGKEYRLIEKKYAFFPEESGTLTIPAFVFTGRIDNNRRGGFSSSLYSYKGKRVYASSKPIEITVKPIPPSYKGSDWLPADDVSVTENWISKGNTFNVGDAITREITIKAKGLPSSYLPQSTPLPSLEGAKFYPEKPEVTEYTSKLGVESIFKQKIAIVPTKDGQLTLPKLDFYWWDVNQNKQIQGELAEKSFQIKPIEVTSEYVGILPTEQTEQKPSLQNTKKSTQEKLWPWQLATLCFLMLWLITGYWLWQMRLKRTKSSSNASGKKNLNNIRSTALKQLNKACKEADASAAKAALLLWANSTWPQQGRISSLTALASRISDQALQSAIYDLDKAMYSNKGFIWTGEQFWKTFKAQSNQTTANNTTKSAFIPQLYDHSQKRKAETKQRA